jgi:hypothetical protein
LAPWAFAVSGFAFGPTVLQIRYRKYALKVISRLLLGVAISLALSAVVFGYSWGSSLAVINIGFLAIVLALGVFTYRWRQRHIDVPCRTCREGQFPFCSWNHPVIQTVLADHGESIQAAPPWFRTFLEAVDADPSMAQGFERRA